ncbi:MULTISPECIES: PAS domain-containing protein [Halobacterium]|uniref:PAS domain-containing protein n=1 Tax=Halobacterium TaxID=2239 RepID=UPI00073FA235|nr:MULTISPECIES: PAS domain-containing protein [Halobacterium]MCG1003361.1 PAS domain-containing protein [Halobacterium noricense]
MGEQMYVVFVSAHQRSRAAAKRALPEHAPLTVTALPTAAATLDALSEGNVDCVAVEHAADGTDGLRLLRLVRDTDPAVPVVVYEAAGAGSIASDAISLNVTGYVRDGDEDDPWSALAGTCHDAAATYRAEQDVAMLNDLARNVYERITDGFFALDRDWRFTYLNDAAEEILEVEADDVVGENIWDAFPAAVGTDFYTEYHRAMAAQEPVTFRERFEPLEHTFEVRAFPSEDGLSVHFRTVVDDGGAQRADHLLELTSVLSSDLLESIDVLRADLEAARAGDDGDAALEDAMASLDRMESLVNHAIRLASERPTPQQSDDE